ncbi:MULTISPECIES: hypothetical protein [Nitrosomonas]|uniref:Uncharacterized protein n=2 Tax=Nitrosomonas eutropha TaxID=916 RepID=A0ABX5M5N3_9PROT|nr:MULTISPECIES: hypothetical protein [Nitrosomonas]ABI59354.1 conserved hypothetical protein [Nitrosomonas eutropha C91]MXS81345.1 hypothetical protein [Nitrosomonas sp. GH22]PXV79762.1 hypothetical protein C8R14_12125 [Nitrosomonas eutropha]SCX25646.1 hypothetical protein SAMN05216379_12823 [Nitrosomonas eutropha]SDW87135.1 hypothetical protein SAMN05216317_11623 [Nitrosomonas eutropha]
MEKFIEQVSLYIHDAPIWPFTLLGLVLVVGVGVDIINHRRRAGAVEYYDSVFHEELIGLYPVTTRWPDDLVAYMQPRLPVLRDAFEVLRNFIPQNQLREYNVAWNKFYQFARLGGNEQEGLPGGNAQDFTAEQLSQHQQQQTFQQMVTVLLVYTEQFKK